MARLLVWLADGVTRRPLLTLVVGTALCLLLGLAAAFVPIDLSFQGLMDPADPRIARYNEMTQRLNLVGRLPLLLEGDEARLDDAARALAAELEAGALAQRVFTAPPRAWLEDNGPWLIDDAGFDDWLRLATHPEDLDSAARLQTRIERLAGEHGLLHHDGYRLLLVVMAHDPLLRPMGDNGYPELEQATQDILARFDVRGTYSGIAAVAQQDQVQILDKVRVLTPLSLLLVLILLSRFEPRPLHLLAVALPMILAGIGTLGAVALIADQIIVIESFFGVLIFGLGVDFALHLMVRAREELERGQDFPQALRATLRHTGGGVVAGGLTTAGAFFIVACAPGPIPLHLGLSGGAGLLLCLVLMLTMLPAIWALLGKRPPKRTRPSLAAPLLRAAAARAAGRPWLVLIAAALFLAATLIGVPRFRFETDLNRVFSRDVPAMAVMARVQELFGVNPSPWIAEARDLDHARQIAAGFARDPLFARVDSVADLIPANSAARMAQLEAAAEEIADQREAYRLLRSLSDDEQAEKLDQATRMLEALQTARAAGPPRPDTLPASLRAQLLSPEGKPLVFAYVAEPMIEGVRAREERLAAEAIAPDAAGVALVYEALLLGDHPFVKWVLLAILVYVTLVLVFDLRRWRLIVLALTPVAFGTCATFGLLCWFELHFNVMTSITVPLIIGLGVDDGIHLVHRLREVPDAPVSDAAASVGRAIVLTTLTTCASVSTLLFTDHPGLESMALVLLVGLPLCLVATVTLVPALARVLGLARAT